MTKFDEKKWRTCRQEAALVVYTAYPDSRPKNESLLRTNLNFEERIRALGRVSKELRRGVGMLLTMGRNGLLSDEQWELIEPLLPPQRSSTGRPMRDHRQVVEGAIYRYRYGLAWRDLPGAFGPWQTVWKRHRRFSEDGTWEKIHQVLLTWADHDAEVD